MVKCTKVEELRIRGNTCIKLGVNERKNSGRYKQEYITEG